MFIFIILLVLILILILISVIGIDITLRKQMNHSKEIDASLKELVYLLKDRSTSQRTEH